MRLAIFDIDGTLVQGSSERMFWRFLLARRRQGLRQLAAYALFMIRYVPVGGIHTVKRNKAYLSGLDTGEIAELAEEFVRTRLLRELHAPAVERLNRHVARGDKVMLMSGTLQPIARSLARHLGAAEAWATLANERGGRYTANPPETHPFDVGKLVLARELARSAGADLAQAAAYGDSRHDLPLLRAVGEPVAVRPDAKLLEVAERLGWEVLPDAGRSPLPFSKAEESRFL